MTEYIPIPVLMPGPIPGPMPVDVPGDVPFGQQPRAFAGVVTRFAPSPNGNLHIGHAVSAISAHDFARAHDGKFLLRIEDIDGVRSRDEYINAIIADLQWLGLTCDGGAIYQSANIARYKAALDGLRAMGLVYRCICSRSDIAAAIKARPVPHGPDGPVYPGTCRRAQIPDDAPACWRLNMKSALAHIAGPLVWNDLAAGAQIADPALFGDVVLWRKDAPASYHLAATLDDHAARISHVVRGQDLFAYTAVHILLQKLLGLLQPAYWHHPLIIDASGNKLGKSRASPALQMLRAQGLDGARLASELRRGKLPLGLSAATD